MPDITLDIFKQDAFSAITLTDAINKMPFVPGRIGELGLFTEQGVPTTSVMLEEKDGALILIPTTKRGAPANQFKPNKRRVRSLAIPHIPLEDTIMADEIQGVRVFGSMTELQTVQTIVNQRLLPISQSFDATLEFHRVGAIKGQVLDADGSTVLYNLFTEFGVSQAAEINFDLENSSPASGAVRKNCHKVIRTIEDNLGAMPYQGIMGVCGSAFMDSLVSHSEVLKAYERWQSNSAAAVPAGGAYSQGDFLRMRLARRNFPYAGIMFEEYRGKVGSIDFVNADKCHFFPVGVPGLFKTVYGPADFIETVNTIGLPRYAKQAIDDEFQRFVKLHTQTNPLNYCTRPLVLVQGKRTA